MKDLKCSFCGKLERQVETLVSAEEAHICGKCIKQAAEALEKAPQQGEPAKQQPISWRQHKPEVLKAYLDRHIIGQQKVSYLVFHWGFLVVTLQL